MKNLTLFTILIVSFLMLGMIQKDFTSLPEKRIALVIGNSTYEDVPLKNPVNDADSIANVLRNELNFEVIKVKNANFSDMNKAMNRFDKKLLRIDKSRYRVVALFYYSGHGMQYEGNTYLLPVQYNVSSPADLQYEAVNFQRIIDRLQLGKHYLSLVMLDACRTNSLTKSLASLFKREDDPFAGYAPPKSSQSSNSGMYISYATAPDKPALQGDADEDNSPYVKGFLNNIRTPNLSVSDLYDNIGQYVKENTRNTQIPYLTKSFYEKYSFKSVIVVPLPKPNSDPDNDGFTNKIDDCPKVYGECKGCPCKDKEEKKSPTASSAKKPIEEPENSLDAFSNLMVNIPSGSFMMGSENGESDEKPAHRVTLSAFKMSKYEVTQQQWRAVMGTNPSSFKNCDDCPVETVSWNDVQAFIQKLNQQTGKNYRLPTEAEWEYACRAGTTTPFNTGNNLTTNQANYNGNYPYLTNAKGEYRQKTTPVGSFSPNAWGLYDMHGNVWEWCQDRYGDYSSSSQTNPTGASSGAYRVLRGGSWDYSAGFCRSASRNLNSPTFSFTYFGFRLILP